MLRIDDVTLPHERIIVQVTFKEKPQLKIMNHKEVKWRYLIHSWWVKAGHRWESGIFNKIPQTIPIGTCLNWKWVDRDEKFID